MMLSDGVEYPHKGAFRAANNQVSTQTGSITVEGLFPNPGMLLRPGLFARVQATIGVQKDALVVPINALITIQNINQLAVVGPDNKVTIRNVNVGITTREEVVIVSGVNEGDKIVIQGIQKVTDGCSVMLLPSSPSPAHGSPAEGNDAEKKLPSLTPSPTPAVNSSATNS